MYEITFPGMKGSGAFRLTWEGHDPQDAGTVSMVKPPRAHRTTEEATAAVMLESLFAADKPVPRDGGSANNALFNSYPLTSWFGLVLAIQGLAGSHSEVFGVEPVKIQGPPPPPVTTLYGIPRGAMV